MPKILVVYYSRGGATFRVAEMIAKELGADLEAIEENAPRKGRLGYMRSLLEATAKGLPTIRTRRDPRDYDLVVLGTPVWAGTMSSPMRAYLNQHRRRLPRVAFFATMGGRGAYRVLEEMEMFCEVQGAPSCFLTQHEVESGLAEKTVMPFVSDVREVLRTPKEITTAA